MAAALVAQDGVQVRARHGESYADYEQHIVQTAAFGADGGPHWVTLDDGADLLIAATRAHPPGDSGMHGLIGGTEETTTGLLRLRRLQEQQGCRAPCSRSMRRALNGR